ncbi:MAG: hypothetical protein CEN91_509 [Candidatus Berkelbacteria bacterium Licking1014_85]|uniref:Uncharacterized protein n=1 Tax=Candidatus Berkelbacteria bacterium Licking1014_85 TaxID=2017148 RepID=A0A554LHC8_9BACT|nr:MAG: hypothetical protein CEN91_509 [Candidatus Berkelbacteria bacterium Licking1014_85]
MESENLMQFNNKQQPLKDYLRNHIKAWGFCIEANYTVAYGRAGYGDFGETDFQDLADKYRLFARVADAIGCSAIWRMIESNFRCFLICLKRVGVLQ